MADPKTTLHLIRHGHAVPDRNVAIDHGADYDEMGLSARGAREAAALARRLRATIPLTAVYTSPTRRARETAEAIGSAFGLDVAHDARIREIALGTETYGHIPAADRANAMRERLRELAMVALRDGSWANVPGAEPHAAVRERVAAAIDAIVARHPDAHVAVVSHAGSIEAYLADVLGIARPFFYPIFNTSLNSVCVVAGNATLLRLNDTAHLEGT